MKVSFTICFVAFFIKHICCSCVEYDLYATVPPIDNYIEYFKDDEVTPCVKESGVDIVNLMALLRNKFHVVSEKPLMKYFICAYLRMGILNEDGSVNKQQMMSHFGVSNRDVQEKLFEICEPDRKVTVDNVLELIYCTCTSLRDLQGEVTGELFEDKQKSKPVKLAKGHRRTEDRKSEKNGTTVGKDFNTKMAQKRKCLVPSMKDVLEAVPSGVLTKVGSAIYAEKIVLLK
ncbi:hypothetical protein FQA39_LY08027 [Lamprigera yunnana]|nr:hypothetical protein FQA39_LY08027 [Lamprigera yunnana]